MKTQLISVAILLSTITTSCEKQAVLMSNTAQKMDTQEKTPEEEIPKNDTTDTRDTPPPSEMPQNDEYETMQVDNAVYEGRRKSIVNATTTNDISAYFFKVDEGYKCSGYIHVKQNSPESSWTNYVLCAGAIINRPAGSNIYKVGQEKIDAVQNWCGNSSIERLRDYANQKDSEYTEFENVVLCKESKDAKGRFNLIKQMFNHLYVERKPFLAIISDNTKQQYVIVWAIDWENSETGSKVFYTDALKAFTKGFNDEVKSMDMTTFLDKMGPSNPYVNKYSALFLR